MASRLVGLLGERLLGQAGKVLPTTEALSGASAVGLYFSAHWCPPCRGFTPQLVKAYEADLAPKGMRCVLVSSDKDEAAFQGYFGSMPWLALPYEDRMRKEDLSSRFGVQSIPTLAILDLEGNTITTEGRNSVVEDPQGKDYPWWPKPVLDLRDGKSGRLNGSPSVVLLCEAADAATQKAALLALTPVAEGRPAVKRNLTQEQELVATQAASQYAFFTATSGELARRVRELCNFPLAGDDPSPARLVLLDVADGGGFYNPLEDSMMGAPITEADVRMLMDGYERGLLVRQQLAPPS